MGGKVMANYLDLLGSGAFSIEDDAAFDLTADVEVRWDAQGVDWSNGDFQRIFDRWDAGSNDRTLRVAYTSVGGIVISLGDGAGAFRTNLTLTPSPALINGQRTQFRVQIDADNGSTETEVTIFTRAGSAIQTLDSDDDWSQVANTTTAGIQSWKATDDAIWAGSSWNTRTSESFTGRLYRLMAWSDLTTTTKFIDVDFTNSTNQTTAGDASEWNDAASANTWDAQGTEGTHWRYVTVHLDNLVDPLSLYGFDSDAIDLQPFRGKAMGTH
jgi:hypothetical protein